MPKRSSKSKDMNQLAASTVAQATGQTTPEPKPEKNPAEVALGRLEGMKIGKPQAAKLAAEQIKDITRKAAQKRCESPKLQQMRKQLA